MYIPLLNKKNTLATSEVMRVIDECTRENAYTPDMWRLERHGWNLLFVYNEMLPGHKMHHLLERKGEVEDSMFYGYTHDRYVMWKHKLGVQSTPLILKVEDIFKGSPLAPVKGFLYGVRPEVFYQLDLYMQNGVLFDRQRIIIDVPYREINNFDRRNVSELKIERVEAYAYIPYAAYWEDALDAGMYFAPVRPMIGKHINQNGRKVDKPYYYWTKLECQT
jgi:hypothetical protein